MISNLLVYVITWYVLHLHADTETSKIGPADAPKFRTVVWVGLSVGVVCTIIFHCFVRESNEVTGNNVRGGQLRLSVRELFSKIQVYQVHHKFCCDHFTKRPVLGCSGIYVNEIVRQFDASVHTFIFAQNFKHDSQRIGISSSYSVHR